MSKTQPYTISGTSENWTITTPDGITITPAANGTLNVNITYTDASLLNNATAHGILSVDFQPVIDKIASFGFHAPINFTVTNGMSVPIAGFDIMTYNDNGVNPTPVPQPGHPTNYAHFHGPGDTPVPLTIFAPETITTELPNFTPSTADTPSIIMASGILAPGQSVTASLEIHNEEIAGDKNGFGFSFFPTGTDTSQATISGLAPTETTNGIPPFLPFINTVVNDANALPIESASITVKDANGNLTDADVLSESGTALIHTGVGTYSFNPTLPSDLNTELQALNFKEVGAKDTLTLTVDNSQGTLPPVTASTIVTLTPTTTIVTDGPTLTGASGEKWSIIKGQAAVNGVVDPTTARVVAMGYANGQIWQENADKNWWSKTSSGDPWVQGKPPALIANVQLQVSANNTVLSANDPTQTIIDANQNTWSFVNGGTVSINGQLDPQTGHGQELAYVNGEVWENADNLWWGKTSPTAAWSPPNGQTLSPLTGSIQQPNPATTAITADALGQTSPTFLASQDTGSSPSAISTPTFASTVAASSTEVPAVPGVSSGAIYPQSNPSMMLGQMMTTDPTGIMAHHI